MRCFRIAKYVSFQAALPRKPRDAGLQLELNDSETPVSRTVYLISVAIIVNPGVPLTIFFLFLLSRIMKSKLKSMIAAMKLSIIKVSTE